MPTKKGELTSEEKRKILAWLKKEMPSPHCELCSSNHFDLMSHFLILSSTPHPTGEHVHYPYFAVACPHCGNTKFINAISTNILSRDMKKMVKKNAKKK